MNVFTQGKSLYTHFFISTNVFCLHVQMCSIFSAIWEANEKVKDSTDGALLTYFMIAYKTSAYDEEVAMPITERKYGIFRSASPIVIAKMLSLTSLF